MSLDDAWQKVKDFHLLFRHPVASKPCPLEVDRITRRYNWMLEELDEFLIAREIGDQADAMIDLMYFAIGTLVEMGIKPQQLFEVVHDANMAKLWEDGKPHFDNEGKVIKSKNWKDPGETINEIISSYAEEGQCL